MKTNKFKYIGGILVLGLALAGCSTSKNVNNQVVEPSINLDGLKEEVTNDEPEKENEAESTDMPLVEEEVQEEQPIVDANVIEIQGEADVSGVYSVLSVEKSNEKIINVDFKYVDVQGKEMMEHKAACEMLAKELIITQSLSAIKEEMLATTEGQEFKNLVSTVISEPVDNQSTYIEEEPEVTVEVTVEN